MKQIKKYLFIIIIILLILAFLFITNIIRIQLYYQINKKNYIQSIPISGTKNHYVPQGLAYSDKYNIILQTSYNSNHKVSMLYVTDFKSKKIIKELKIKEINQKDNLHHVGGIATDNNKVWITSDYEVNEYSLDEIIRTKNDYIQSRKNTKLKIRGDFCTYYNNTLWIGDFFLSPFYKVPNNNPLLLGYNINEIEYDNPNIIISIPKMIQGLTFNEKGEFIFTASFTYLINSKLLIYQNILQEKPQKTYSFYGKKIPYYNLTKEKRIKKISIPPMAEGLFYKDNFYYILFENSSDTYSFAFPKINKLIQYKIEK